MTTNSPRDAAPRSNPRVPFQTKVNLEFEKFSGFISEFSSNISEGGMFVKSLRPKPVGTVLSFEFRLSDNFTLIQGLGEVVWIRTDDSDETKPPGMGIKFRDIDAKSRELIKSIISHNQDRGQQTFEVLPAPPDSQTAKLSENSPQMNSDEAFSALFQVPNSASPSEPKDAGTVDSFLGGTLEEVSTPSIARTRTEPLPEPETLRSPPLAVDDLPSLSDDLEPKDDFFTEEKPSTPIAKILILITVVVIPFALAWFFRTPLQKLIGRHAKPTEVAETTSRRSVPPKVQISTNPTPPAEVTSPPVASPAPASSTPEAVPTQPPSAETPAPTKAAFQQTPEPLPTVQASPSPPETEQAAQPEPAPAPPPTVIPRKLVRPRGTTATFEISQVKSSVENGQTVLWVQANQPISKSRIAHVYVPGAKPKEVVKFLHAGAPFSKASVNVGSAHVQRLRFGFHEKTLPGEIHMVVDLANGEARIRRIELLPGNQMKVYVR